jgi:hypothetical protein
VDSVQPFRLRHPGAQQVGVYLVDQRCRAFEESGAQPARNRRDLHAGLNPIAQVVDVDSGQRTRRNGEERESGVALRRLERHQSGTEINPPAEALLAHGFPCRRGVLVERLGDHRRGGGQSIAFLQDALVDCIAEAVAVVACLLAGAIGEEMRFEPERALTHDAT